MKIYFFIAQYITIVLATLKITNQIDWSWYVIMLPIVGPLIVMGLSIVSLVIGISIMEKYHEIRRKL